MADIFDKNCRGRKSSHTLPTSSKNDLIFLSDVLSENSVSFFGVLLACSIASLKALQII